MAINVTVTLFDWSGDQPGTLLTVPDTCPICHTAVQPRRITGVSVTADDKMMEYIFQCVQAACRRTFVGTYGKVTSTKYELIQTGPKTPQKSRFSDEIESLSPMFSVIFNQANTAESVQLDQIAGMGYRKALEFLIKDFAVEEHPDKADEIKARFLGQVIQDYVADPNLKATAKRAAWLGNDETHYVRKWEEKDIRDLKLLTRLAVNWVENVMLTRKYEKQMPD